jgi:hypothetical protein
MRIGIFGAGAIGGYLAVGLAGVREVKLSVIARGAHLTTRKRGRWHWPWKPSRTWHVKPAGLVIRVQSPALNALLPKMVTTSPCLAGRV